MTRHTRFLRTHTNTSRSFTGAAVLLALALGLFAAPARADHNDGPRGPEVACSLHHDGPCTPACAFGIRGPYSRSQFDNGFYTGQDEGLDAGFEAGLRGYRFCDEYPCHLPRQNRFFQQGFLEGYSAGYAQGFEEGREKRLHWRGRGWGRDWDRGRGRGHGRGRGRGCWNR